MNSKCNRDYWDKGAPWWIGFRLWCQDKIWNNQLTERIPKNEKNDNNKTAQLCKFLRLIRKNEEKEIQENDSFTQWILKEGKGIRKG